MTPENLPQDTHDKLSEIQNDEGGNFQDKLAELKKEFHEMKTHTDTESYDVALGQLTERISTLLAKEGNGQEEKIADYPELVNLMRDVVHQVHYGKEDLFTESFSLSEEKRLLLDLMYSVLANIGRREQERKVKGFTEDAIKFFDKLGMTKLYTFLLKKAA